MKGGTKLSSFSRKHYRAIAEIIKNVETKYQVAQDIAKMFSEDNDRFDYMKFFKKFREQFVYILRPHVFSLSSTNTFCVGAVVILVAFFSISSNSTFTHGTSEESSGRVEVFFFFRMMSIIEDVLNLFK